MDVQEFIDNYLKVIKENYANFEGRARRKEFWMFVAVNIAVSIICSVIDGIIGISFGLGIVYSLVVFIPGIALAVRRLHDLNKSGWMLLIALIPFAGLYLLYLCTQEGERQTNQYGPDPKEGEA